MTNYNPPINILTEFNPAVFEDNFTTNEVDTKLKNLETNKIESAGNLYIERGQKTSTDSTGTITYTANFTSAPFVFCQVEDDSTTILKTIIVSNVLKTSFNFRCIQSDASTISTVSSPFFYTVIGDIA
jgi:hypothetical protein